MNRPATRRALRLAMTPRWLTAAAVLVAFIVLAVFLGRWQWDRTQTILAAERAALSQPVPVGEVLAADAEPLAELPDDGIGRPVSAAGEYVPGLQSVVTSREHRGVPGVWIVTGLRLDDGRTIAVLRGWLASADAPGAAVPSGRVEVGGVLQPDESFYADAANASGSVAAIAHDALGSAWGTQLLPGFMVLATQRPASDPAPEPVVPTVQTADVPFPLQNFFYAFQWWLFALFGVAVYLRWLWLEATRSPEPAQP